MLDYAPFVVVPVLVWWFSTGVVLWLDGLPVVTYGRSVALATVALVVALAGSLHASQDASALGACLAFGWAIVIWGWLELTYLTGVLTGPRSEPCPSSVTVGERFMLALQTSIYHELAVVVCGIALLVMTADAPNPFGAWSFLALWLMRWSTKLNIFLGVPNLAEEFWPDHMRYLSSYCGHRPMNRLFPVSVSAGTIACVLLAFEAAAATTAVSGAGFTILATLVALAVLEHWFLVLPLREARLWQWALGQRHGASDQSGQIEPRASAAIVPPVSGS